MADPMTPPANLGDGPSGYPSRRTLPQPSDNPGRYPAPPGTPLPTVPQMTAAPPPRPTPPGPGEPHFKPEAIPGTSLHNVNSRQESPVKS